MSETARVLIVDDDDLTRAVLVHRLGRQGIAVATASDGAEGLRRAREFAPHVIVLDMMMPVLDGRQVLHELRADPALRDVPVIMLSALRNETDLAAARKLGADDYVAKPFSAAELAARIVAVLPPDRRRQAG